MKIQWRKPSFSCSTDHVTEQCFEVARLGEGNIAIRNSQFKDAIIGTPAEFKALVEGCKAGEFDDLT